LHIYKKKNFPEVALHFVQDERTQFNLALECGNIDIALEAAKALDDKDCWQKLAVEALRQGNHQIVEMAYQRTNNYDRLSFLYLITGNIEKLKMMLKVAEKNKNAMGRFHTSLYLGDVQERVKLLQEVGQTSLAYVTAQTHNLEQDVKLLSEKLEKKEISKFNFESKLLQPPIPFMKQTESNWPLLNRSVSVLDKFKQQSQLLVPEEPGPGEPNWKIDAIEDEPGFGNEPIAGIDDEEPVPSEENLNKEGILDIPQESQTVEIGWLHDELNLPEDTTVQTTTSSDAEYFVSPNPGPEISQIWSQNSNLAADHVAGGSVESAMQLLYSQVGVVNFAPLKQFFLPQFMASHIYYPGVPVVHSLSSHLQRNWSDAGPRGGLPVLIQTLPQLIERLRVAYTATTGGKFNDAEAHFLHILYAILLLVVNEKQEISEVKELVGICREYLIGIRLELSRRDLKDEIRKVELAAYFTHCSIQTAHLTLSLLSAMTAAYKINNFQTAASFCKRLLDLGPKPDVVAKAKKVLQVCDKTPTNEHTLKYDERNPFVICGLSLTPIYKGNPLVRCPFCSTSYLLEHKGKVCVICKVSQIGVECLGLMLNPNQFR